MSAAEQTTTHKPYVTVTWGMFGHFAVLMWWNHTIGEGFWEPYDSGAGRYKTREEAVEEATGWAENEGLELKV